MIVYLDLDRTLFKTHLIPELWAALETVYPELRGAYESRDSYCHQIDELYYYDMGAHLEALGLVPEEVYGAIAGSELADGRYEYEGAEELITYLLSAGYEPQLLTFGTEDYQRFKASLCPALLGLPIVTTLRPKPEVLEDLEEGCWLVDDRPLGDELPNNVSFIQVNLEGAPEPPYVDWPVKHSLREVKEFFDAIMH